MNQKNELLTKANVLLISDDEEDYEELKKSGFKNISYFKSIIRADNYFRNNPNELEQYHIIINGSHKVQRCCFNGEVELDKKINETKHKALVTHLYKTERFNQIEYNTLLNDWENHKSWEITSHSLKNVYEEIIKAAIITEVLKKVKTTESFSPAKDYINPNKLPLPSKKSDLKILYLDKIRVSRYADKIAETLGLNITFKEDDNTTLGKYVKASLGEYDIIIVSDSYSRSILDMNKESTEQCKDTGRELTLLVTYDKKSIPEMDEDKKLDMDGFGLKINLNYSFGGNLAPDQEKHSKEFRVLRRHDDEVPNDAYKTFDENEITEMEGIIEAVVNIYNESLLQNDKESIDDLDFLSMEELDREFEIVEQKENNRILKALEPIKNYDSMIYTITNYMSYLKRGFIEKEPTGLRVTERKDFYQIDNIENEHIVSSITVPKNYKKDNLRVFKIRTTLNDGSLSKPRFVGLYTRKYEKLENVPYRPNESQRKALTDIYEKINTLIRPLCNEAWEKENLISRQKRIQ